MPAFFARHRAEGFVFLLALFLRMLYLYESSDNPAFLSPVSDAKTYHQLALHLAQGQPMGVDFFWQPFLYPFFLYLVYLIAGPSLVVVKVLQGILGALACVLTFRLGEKIFNRKTGMAAGILLAAHGPSIFYDGDLVAAGLAAFGSAALILMFLAAREKPLPWRCALLGVCGALSVQVRTDFLPFFIAGCGWLFYRPPVRPRVWSLASVAAGFALVCAPIVIQRYQVTGGFGFFPMSGPINLYVGNNPDRCETLNLRPGFDWIKLTQKPSEAGTAPSGDVSRYYTREVVRYVRSQPLDFLKGLAVKSAEFFSSREIPRNEDLYVYRSWSRVLSFLVFKAGGFGFPFGILLPLAAAGLFFRRREVPGILHCFIIVYPLSIAAVFVSSRYRVPWIPALCVLGAAGFFSLAGLVKARRWSRAAMVFAALPTLAAATSVPGPYCEETFNYEAEMFNALGLSRVEEGRLGEALPCYEKSISLNPAYAEAHFNLGCLLNRMGRVESALGHWDRTLAIHPAHEGALANRCFALQALGKEGEALACFTEAAGKMPGAADCMLAAGKILLTQGRVKEALPLLEKCAAIDPAQTEAFSFLGDAYRYLGLSREALRVYQAAIRHHPLDPDLHFGLGLALAGAGDSRAVEAFNAALRLNPAGGKIYYALASYYAKAGRRADAADIVDRLRPVDSALHQKAKGELKL